MPKYLKLDTRNNLKKPSFNAPSKWGSSKETYAKKKMEAKNG